MQFIRYYKKQLYDVDISRIITSAGYNLPLLWSSQVTNTHCRIAINKLDAFVKSSLIVEHCRNKIIWNKKAKIFRVFSSIIFISKTTRYLILLLKQVSTSCNTVLADEIKQIFIYGAPGMANTTPDSVSYRFDFLGLFYPML